MNGHQPNKKKNNTKQNQIEILAVNGRTSTEEKNHRMKRGDPVSVNKNLPLNVDTILVYKDKQFSFGFSQRCPASRLYETVTKGLGIKIDHIEHQPNLNAKRTLIPNDPKVWVLEDCGVKEGSFIHIIGEDGESPQQQPPEMRKMLLLWKGVQKEPSEFFVRQGTSVVKLIKSIRLQFKDVLPDSVKLFYGGEELKDWNAVPEWKDGELITMEGTFVPVSLLRPNAVFAKNIGVFMSTECTICLEKLKNAVLFDCGHGNVCGECWGKRQTKTCPLCPK